MSDGSTHFATGFFNSDGVTTSACGQRLVNNGVLVETDTAGTETGLIALASRGSDTFTLSVPNAFANSGVGEYYAVAGLDNVAVKIYQEATATGNYDRTGAGFDPTSAFFLGIGGTTINAGGSLGNGSIGFAAGANQAGYAFRYRPGQTADYLWNRISTAEVLARLNDGSTPAVASAFVSFITDGVRLDKTVGTTALYFGVALMRGGAPKVVTTAALTSVTTQDVAVSGMTPTGALFLAAPQATATETNGREGLNFSFGDFAGSNQGAMTIVAANRETLTGGQATEEYTLNRTDACVLDYDRTGADTLSAVGLISKSATDDEEITLSQDDADTAAILIAMLVFGDAFAGGGGGKPVTYYHQLRAS
jgi:hypothetical protein